MVNEDVKYYADKRGPEARAQIDYVADLLLYYFESSDWAPLTRTIAATGEVITVTPIFDEDVEQKSTETCIEYRCLDASNRKIKSLSVSNVKNSNKIANLKRFVMQMQDYIKRRTNNDTSKLEIIVKLENRFGKGVKNGSEVQDTLAKCQAKQPVKLIYLANNVRNYPNGEAILAADPMAIEVRTMDDQPLGLIPREFDEKPRAAKYLTTHYPHNIPYEAEIYRIEGGRKLSDGTRAPYKAYIYIKFDD